MCIRNFFRATRNNTKSASQHIVSLPAHSSKYPRFGTSGIHNDPRLLPGDGGHGQGPAQERQSHRAQKVQRCLTVCRLGGVLVDGLEYWCSSPHAEEGNRVCVTHWETWREFNGRGKSATTRLTCPMSPNHTLGVNIQIPLTNVTIPLHTPTVTHMHTHTVSHTYCHSHTHSVTPTPT